MRGFEHKGTPGCSILMQHTSQVGPKKIIELKYILREGNASGEVLEEMNEHWPLKFLFGSGAMLPVFEENLSPLSEGQLFAFPIKAVDAYGEHDASQVIQVFLDELEENPRYPFSNYEVDDLIQLQTRKGEQHAGRITEIGTNYFVVDCNHAMSGKDLWFEGQILFIRDARKDELEANRYIEPNGFRSHSTLREPPNE